MLVCYRFPYTMLLFRFVHPPIAFADEEPENVSHDIGPTMPPSHHPAFKKAKAAEPSPCSTARPATVTGRTLPRPPPRWHLPIRHLERRKSHRPSLRRYPSLPLRPGLGRNPVCPLRQALLLLRKTSRAPILDYSAASGCGRRWRGYSLHCGSRCQARSGDMGGGSTAKTRGRAEARRGHAGSNGGWQAQEVHPRRARPDVGGSDAERVA